MHAARHAVTPADGLNAGSAAAPSSCWALVGVLSSISAGGLHQRELIRGSYVRLRSNICVRFLLGNSTSAAGGTRLLKAAHFEAASHADITWLPADDANCGEKSFRWFSLAARAHTGSVWVGKADDDAFLNLPLLEEELRRIDGGGSGGGAFVGLLHWASAWLLRGGTRLEPTRSGSHAGQPCGQIRQLASGGTFAARSYLGRRAPKACGRSTNGTAATGEAALEPSLTGRYPFGAGPLYLLSQPLLAAAFGTERSARFGAEQAFSCRAEDATIGYAVQLGARARGLNYSLHHIGWSRLHDFHPTFAQPRLGPPSASTLVVHALKCGRTRPAVWSTLLRSMEEEARRSHARQAAPPPHAPPPLLRFEWSPASQTLVCTDHPRWKQLERAARQPPDFGRARPLLTPAAWHDAACRSMNRSAYGRARKRGECGAFMPGGWVHHILCRTEHLTRAGLPLGDTWPAGIGSTGREREMWVGVIEMG